MSHISTLKVSIQPHDITALQNAAAALGGTLNMTATTFHWYHKDDPCDMRIEFPGQRYHVGVIKGKDGNYELKFDAYEGLGKLIGNGGEILTQNFAAEKIQAKARARGYGVQRETQDGKIRMILTKF